MSKTNEQFLKISKKRLQLPLMEGKFKNSVGTVLAVYLDTEVGWEHADVSSLWNHALLLVRGHGGVERVFTIWVASIQRRANVTVYRQGTFNK